MTLRTIPAAVFAIAWSLSWVHAWDPLGHMLTMKIACASLTPQARLELDAALARFNAKENPDSPYDALTAACWMDDVRSKTREFNEWHYVNLPPTREGLPVPEGSRSKPDLIWALARCEKIVKGSAEEDGVDRDKALVMLLHLGGDIHQPLHATQRNDQGGNRTRIANMRDEQADLMFSKGGNLHFFWDSAYRRRFLDGEAGVAYAAPLFPPQTPVAGHNLAREIVDRVAAELQQKHPPESLGYPTTGSARDWALESHRLGYDLGYEKLPAFSPGEPVKLDQDYVDSARDCAEKRIALAGYRLGALLNQLLDPIP